MSNLVSETRLMWDMPITVAISDPPSPALIGRVFAYFEYIDGKFSTFKPYSEISLINAGMLGMDEITFDMHAVFLLAEQFRQETDGYFNIARDGRIDPLGLVKGWALSNAAEMLRDAGCRNFYVEAGGDLQAVGTNPQNMPWQVGIRNPFNIEQIVKVLAIRDQGVATSGTYIRGPHINNPLEDHPADPDVLSITVIAPDVCEADCYATAAFAMGRPGIAFIESLEGFEGYLIDSSRRATFTSGFERYVDHANH